MRILMMAHLFPPRHCAGAEMMALSMLRPLAERGHTVDVLLSRPTPDPGPYELDGVTVHPYEGQDDPLEWVPKADLVLTHLENTPRAVILSRLARKPFGIICHNTHEPTAHWCVPDANIVVFNSQWMADELGPHDRGLIVRPPVAAADYATDGLRAVKARDRRQAVTLVNLNGEKGGEVFWELARRLPDVQFQAVKGAYGTQIVHDLPNVAVVEHGTEMRAVYARTRLLVMPSAYESWGRVGVEAMCSGIPVVAAPTPGLLESLGDAGTFVDVHDVDGWETAVTGLLQPEAWRAASRKARARAAELDPAEDLARWVDAVEVYA